MGQHRRRGCGTMVYGTLALALTVGVGASVAGCELRRRGGDTRVNCVAAAVSSPPAGQPVRAPHLSTPSAEACK